MPYNDQFGFLQSDWSANQKAFTKFHYENQFKPNWYRNIQTRFCSLEKIKIKLHQKKDGKLDNNSDWSKIEPSDWSEIKTGNHCEKG